jgi:hypothetical protein
MLPQSLTGPFQLCRRKRNHCGSNHLTGAYTVTYTICESVDTTMVKAHRIVHLHGNVNVVGQIIAEDDTLNPSSSPLASGTTPVAAQVNMYLPRTAVTTNNTNVTPITTGPIFSWCRRNVTIVKQHPNGSYATYTICESVQDAANGASPSNCTSATLTVNVVVKSLRQTIH